MSSLGGKAAIAGIGQTEFSKESGRSELQLACEAVKAAIDDAGLQPSDIDGMVTFTMDSNEEIEVARNVGIGDLTFFTRVPHGGGAAAGTVVQAAMAVATGIADVVVCYRAFNERSGFRFGGSTARASGETPLWLAPYAPVRVADAGGVGRAARSALHVDVRRHQRGLRQDLGRRPRPRGPQSRRVVLRAPHHTRGPPELAVDHRAGAATARLLPGERRRRRAGRHQCRARTRPAPAAGGDHRGGAGRGLRRRGDDKLLPRRHHRSARDGRGRRKAVARFGTQARRHPDRVPLRPLHAVRVRAARGARLLRSRRGEGLRDRREPVARRDVCRSTRTAGCSARHTSTA